MCNEEIMKHMKEDMTFRSLSEKHRNHISGELVDIWIFTKEN